MKTLSFQNVVKFAKKSLEIFVFNLNGRFFPKLTDYRIKILRRTPFCVKMDDAAFQKLLHSVRIVKYAEDKLICSEGEKGSKFFVITKGSARVFTWGSNKEKIPLARLNDGQYFGEQALLREVSKARNASVEAIVDTVLIEINEKFLQKELKADSSLTVVLKQLGYQEALQILSSSNEFYKDINSLYEMPGIKILELVKDDVVFREGDDADKVYIVLDGRVQLLITNMESRNIGRLLINKKQVFGELGVLSGRPRAATAIAYSKTLRLLAIPGDQFKQTILQKMRFRLAFSKLRRGYELPMRGSVEQYIGKVIGMGDTITNLYRMNDGKTILSLRSLERDIFTISIQNIASDIKSYQYNKGKNFLKITALDKQIVSITADGVWDKLPEMCGLLLDSEPIDDVALVDFPTTCEIKASNPAARKSDIVCNCMLVTSHQLQNLIDQGIKSFEGLSKATGACTGCGSCAYKVLEMLHQNPWVNAVMKRELANNSYINSYRLSPVGNKFNPVKPGQHVVVRIKINENVIERPYSVSGVNPDGSLRVTIKTESKGYLTQWLAMNAATEINVSVSQPQGDFLLNTETGGCVVCFAGGVGITPFARFAQWLAESSSDKQLQIVYSASTESDFVLKDEFKDMVDKKPTSSVEYWVTKVNGRLTEKDIVNIIKPLSDPDVYICGPVEFTDMISKALAAIQYPAKKIHIETFMYVASGGN